MVDESSPLPQHEPEDLPRMSDMLNELDVVRQSGAHDSGESGSKLPDEAEQAATTKEANKIYAGDEEIQKLTEERNRAIESGDPTAVKIATDALLEAQAEFVEKRNRKRHDKKDK